MADNAGLVQALLDGGWLPPPEHLEDGHGEWGDAERELAEREYARDLLARALACPQEAA